MCLNLSNYLFYWFLLSFGYEEDCEDEEEGYYSCVEEECVRRQSFLKYVQLNIRSVYCIISD